MDMSLSKLQKTVKDREVWYAAVHRVLRQECVSSGLLVGIKVVGLSVWQILRVCSGESRGKAWYLIKLPSSLPVISKVAGTCEESGFQVAVQRQAC